MNKSFERSKALRDSICKILDIASVNNISIIITEARTALDADNKLLDELFVEQHDKKELIEAIKEQMKEWDQEGFDSKQYSKQLRSRLKI